MQVPRVTRPLSDGLRERDEQRPGLRARPRQGSGRNIRALPGQALHQRVLAPSRDEPLSQQHRDESVGEKALPDRLRRAGRHHRRLHPAIAGPPVPPPAVRPHPHGHQPVQLLRHVIAQQRERLPALRAAVPAPGKIPDDLNPGQMRVIPPSRPRPRTPPGALAAPAVRARLPAPVGVITASRPRPRPLRRPPEQHPLQNRQVSPHPVQLRVPLRITLEQPRVLLPQPRVLLAKLACRLRQLPVRLQRGSQRIQQRRLSNPRIPGHASRNRHAAQRTPSAAANHAPRVSVSQPTPPMSANAPAHTISEYLRKTGGFSDTFDTIYPGKHCTVFPGEYL